MAASGCAKRTFAAMLMWATVTDGRESRARSCLRGTLFYENSDRSEYTGEVFGRLPRTRIERIASEQTGITADTALRLAKALGTTAQLWLNLQNDYHVQISKRDLGNNLDRIEIVNKPKAA